MDFNSVQTASTYQIVLLLHSLPALYLLLLSPSPSALPCGSVSSSYVFPFGGIKRMSCQRILLDVRLECVCVSVRV